MLHLMDKDWKVEHEDEDQGQRTPEAAGSAVEKTGKDPTMLLYLEQSPKDNYSTNANNTGTYSVSYHFKLGL